MRTLVIQNCMTEDIGLYEEYMKINGIQYDILHAYRGKRFPSTRKYNTIIVGGTPISANKIREHPYLIREWRFLKEAVIEDKPILGICFGAQILAKILGAEVKKMPKMEIGTYHVELTEAGQKSKIFKDFPNQFPVFHWHSYTFKTPKKAELIVKGKDCSPNQAFKHRNQIGLQFHLELTPKAIEKWIEKYRHELTETCKTKTRILQECSIMKEEMKKLAYKLMGNFLNI